MAEPTTYPLADVLRLTGLSLRTIRHYVQERLVTGAEPRGPATIYTREQVVRLQVIALLRRRDRLSIPKIRQRLAGLSHAEIEAMLPRPEPPPAKANADTSIPDAVRWDHVMLLPGLELRVRSDAGPIVRRLAGEIVTAYRSAE